MRPKLWIFGLLICVIHVKLSEQQFLETAAVAEAAEIIGVVRIGVSLVEYIYKGKESRFPKTNYLTVSLELYQNFINKSSLPITCLF